MEAVLKKISNDLTLIRSEISELREEIDSLRAVKPSYIKKLESIEKKGNSELILMSRNLEKR